jgi:copper chaperone CopZ
MMNTKLTLTVAALVASLSFASAAETTVTLSGVHNCCNGCAKGITEAAGKVKDVEVKAAGRNVMLTGKSKSALKKAVEAILDAGYFGTVGGSDAEKSPGGSASTALAPKPKMTKSATVSGLHLCCQKCADAVNTAAKSVAGVTETDAVSKAKSFNVKGDFDQNALAVALQGAGFNGKIR